MGYVPYARPTRRAVQYVMVHHMVHLILLQLWSGSIMDTMPQFRGFRRSDLPKVAFTSTEPLIAIVVTTFFADLMYTKLWATIPFCCSRVQHHMSSSIVVPVGPRK